MFVFFKHCTYIAKGRIRNIPQAQTKRYRQTSTYSNNNKQTNNNPDPSSPVELLLVRTTRKKTLEKIVTLLNDKNLGKIVKSVRHESANQERQRPNNWPNSHETSWP